jgi:hypothetical protein
MQKSCESQRNHEVRCDWIEPLHMVELERPDFVYVS